MRLGLGEHSPILSASSDEIHAITFANLEHGLLRVARKTEVASSTIPVLLAQLVRIQPILIVDLPRRRDDQHPGTDATPRVWGSDLFPSHPHNLGLDDGADGLDGVGNPNSSDVLAGANLTVV